jgi:DNA-binding MarR family transcriptional regulator
MADGGLYTLSALAKATGWEKKAVRACLQRLVEHVEAVEVRVVSWKSKTVKNVRVYRLKRAAGPQALSGRRVEPQALGRSGKPSFDILAAMADGALWTVSALAIATHHKWSTIKLRLKRLAELGFVEAVEVTAARRRGAGFATVPVYRIAEKGLEALERGLPPELEEKAPRFARDPTKLLKVMEGGEFWTLSALAKATGWEKKAVRACLQRLVEHVEAVEVRKASRKRKEVVTERVYRLKRGDRAAALGGRRVEPQATGRPDLDILAAMSDGALWTVRALKFATRCIEGVVRWHLRRLVELGFVEAVEVRVARRRGPGLATARLYRIAGKGLEALERGLPPLPEVAPPRAEPEPPEGGDPVQLAVWVVGWSAYAARILLHLRRSGEDTYNNVAVAAGGYRYMPSKSDFNVILFRLRELDLIEWERRRASSGGRPRRIIRLTEKGRQVADAILKLAALLAETGAGSFYTGRNEVSW